MMWKIKISDLLGCISSQSSKEDKKQSEKEVIECKAEEENTTQKEFLRKACSFQYKEKGKPDPNNYQTSEGYHIICYRDNRDPSIWWVESQRTDTSAENYIIGETQHLEMPT